MYDPNQEKLVQYSEDKDIVSYKYDLLSELNLLIENDVIIERTYDLQRVDTSDFYFLRANCKLSKKDTLGALSDYHIALKTTNSDLKTRVARTIADFYLRFNNTDHNQYESNRSQALKYLDLVSPIEFSDTLNGTEAEPFLRDKKELLLWTKQYSRLEKYLVKIIEYLFLKAERRYDHQQFLTNKEYEYVLSESWELANLYFHQFEDYQKSKQILELNIKFIPDDTYNYIYSNPIHFAKNYYLLNKIYRTEQFQNSNLEMRYLIDALITDRNGYNFDLYSGNEYRKYPLKEYMIQILEKYPKKAEVYLAWAISKMNDELVRKTNFVDRQYPMTISDLFDKTDKLGFEGYELPYSKALYHFYKKEYELALSEIETALEIHQGAHLITLKGRIQTELPSPNYQEIEKIKTNLKKDYYDYTNLDELIIEIKKTVNR
jgi:hypothetical protein